MTVIIDISFKKSDRSKRVVLEENDEIVVGRSNDDILMTADPRLSRQHFLIRHVGGAIELEHLSRTNPTLVAVGDSRDFQKIKGAKSINSGCRIIAGFHRFVLTLETAETLQQSSVQDKFNVASSWSDMEDDDDDDSDIAPVSNTRATRQTPGGARFSFDDSVVDEPVPGRNRSAANRPAISFESEFQPVDKAPKIDRTRPKKDVPPLDNTKATDVDESEPPVSPPPKSTSKKNNFLDFDDSEDEVHTTPAPERASEGSSEDKKKSESNDQSSGFTKKLHFPVADSFFDD